MGRIVLGCALFAFVASAVVSADGGGVLVHYDFDRGAVETGPYTLMVFEHSQGTVELTSAYRLSGDRSVEIRDVAGDGDFAELQGYFPDKTSGKLFVHFALMTAKPDERFNVALAGPSHFTLKKNGIGFWLKGKGGALYHVSGGEDRRLLPLRSFVWYLTDLVYDIDAGTYDLTIRREGVDEPLVSLEARPNATAEPGSMIHKFSFIGDPPGLDGSNAHFFVDDIVIRADRPIAQGPFVAPGRRMLFVDLWGHYRKRMYERPACPPFLDHADFGLLASDLRALSDAGVLQAYEAVAGGSAASPGRLPDDLPPDLEELFGGLRLWAAGCAAVEECPQCAVDALDRARDRLADAPLVPMSLVLALAGQGRWAEADELLLSIYADWQNDPRFPAISAVLGIARGKPEQAESWLALTPEDLPEEFDDPLIRRLWSGEVGRPLVDELKVRFAGAWARIVETALVAEHRYYVLLWQGRFDEAFDYAGRMIDRFRRLKLPLGRWLERRGDAAFHVEDYAAALRAYEQALGDTPHPASALLKLSDVHFKLGNAELERAYRQKIYGTLEPKWTQRDPAPQLEWGACQLCPGSE